MAAIALSRGDSLTYRLDIGHDGDYTLRAALIPTHPSDKGDLRFSLSIDGQQPTVYSLREPFRSERWKLNVLCCQARRELRATLAKGTHTLTLKALDDHIVVDQVSINQ